MIVDRTSLTEQIKAALIKSITSGEIAPGERLVELDLAERFGVSQAPVREALRDLTMVGLVVKSSNRGTYAGEFASSAMHEIFAVRGALEELATRLATPILSKDTGPLQQQLDAMVSAAEAGETDAVAAHSLAFHSMIVDAADNIILSQMWRTLNLETHTQAAVHQQVEHLIALARSHQPLVDTIASGDVERACLAARQHQSDLDEITQQHAEDKPE